MILKKPDSAYKFTLDFITKVFPLIPNHEKLDKVTDYKFSHVYTSSPTLNNTWMGDLGLNEKDSLNFWILPSQTGWGYHLLIEGFGNRKEPDYDKWLGVSKVATDYMDEVSFIIQKCITDLGIADKYPYKGIRDIRAGLIKPDEIHIKFHPHKLWHFNNINFDKMKLLDYLGEKPTYREGNYKL